MTGVAARANSRWHGWLIVLAAAAVAAAIYAQGLNGLLVLDDHSQVVPILDDAASGERGALWAGHLFAGNGPTGRPAAMASFILDALAHGPDPAAFKATNLLIHIACGLLVFLLTRRLFQRAWADASSASVWAGVAAAIWLLHPLQVSTVLYTVQRMTQLATLFTLAGLLLYVEGRLRQLRGGGGWGALLAAFLLCFPLAVASKENALVFPLLALITEWIFFAFAGTRGTRRGLAALYGVFLLAPAAMVVAMFAVNPERLAAGYATRDFTLGERLLTEPRVLALYLRQTLIPATSGLGFFHDGIVPSRGLADPPATLMALAVPVGLLVAGVLLRRRAPVVGWGLLIWLAAHLIEGSIVALELAFEHRNHLPSAALAAAVCASLRGSAVRPGVAAVLAGGFIMASAGGLAAYVNKWADAEEFHSAMARLRPESPRLRSILAAKAAGSGDYAIARQLLAGDGRLAARLQLAQFECIERQEVAPGTLGAIRIGPAATVANLEVGLIGELTHLFIDGSCRMPAQDLAAMLDGALLARTAERTARVRLNVYRAHFLRATGRSDEAFAGLEAAAVAGVPNPLPMIIAAEWAHEAGDLPRAARYAARARALAGPEDRSGILDRLDRRLARRDSGPPETPAATPASPAR